MHAFQVLRGGWGTRRDQGRSRAVDSTVDISRRERVPVTVHTYAGRPRLARVTA